MSGHTQVPGDRPTGSDRPSTSAGDSSRLLVLLRHGQSTWNAENRFTGWTDVDLSDIGVAEAHRAARLLHERGVEFDVGFSSVLKRAIRTLWIIQDDLDRMWVPVHLSWRLNERHYGALQGLDKTETASRLGSEQVQRWRRSYRSRPPALEASDPRCCDDDPRYAALAPADVPRAESLADTVSRVLPFWQASIVPRLAAGERVLIVAHGNSLRALVKHLDAMGDKEIAELELPTGVPLIYRLDAHLRPVDHELLDDSRPVHASGLPR